MTRKKSDDDHYMSSVRLGPKEQIVVPKETGKNFAHAIRETANEE